VTGKAVGAAIDLASYRPAKELWNTGYHSFDTLAGTYRKDASVIWSISVSPTGKQLAFGSDDATIWLLDVQDHDPNSEERTHDHHKDVRRVDSTSIIDSECELRRDPFAEALKRTMHRRHDDSAQSGRRLMTGHIEGVTSVVFSPDGTRIVSGSHDWTVRIWDTRSGNPVHAQLRGHNDIVDFVAFSPDGKRVISVSRAQNICVWNTDSGDLLFGPLNQHEEGTLAVAFVPSSTPMAVSPDGKWIAWYTGSCRRTVEVLDSKTGRLAATFDIDEKKVQSHASSPGSNRVPSPSHIETHNAHSSSHPSGVWWFFSRFRKKSQPKFYAAPLSGSSRIFPPSSESLQSFSPSRNMTMTHMLSPSLSRTYNHSFTFSPDSTQILLPFYDGTICVQSLDL
jgi:hypothetical protein